jgi:hypothetical protein
LIAQTIDISEPYPWLEDNEIKNRPLLGGGAKHNVVSEVVHRLKPHII